MLKVPTRPYIDIIIEIKKKMALLRQATLHHQHIIFVTKLNKLALLLLHVLVLQCTAVLWFVSGVAIRQQKLFARLLWVGTINVKGRAVF